MHLKRSRLKQDKLNPSLGRETSRLAITKILPCFWPVLCALTLKGPAGYCFLHCQVHAEFDRWDTSPYLKATTHNLQVTCQMQLVPAAPTPRQHRSWQLPPPKFWHFFTSVANHKLSKKVGKKLSFSAQETKSLLLLQGQKGALPFKGFLLSLRAIKRRAPKYA